MSPMLIKILGTTTTILVGAAIGGVGGIIMSYIISTSKPAFSFNYGLAIITGIAGGVYGLVYSIRELWLR